MVTARLIVLVWVLGVATSARAESPKLAEARRAIEEVRYDRAQELLGEALRAGGSEPATVIEIYSLAASTAVVLGNVELAEQFYRRLLSLDPRATLDADLAPKFKKPFTAAQAYVSAHGALRATARRLGDGGLEVVVESDPLTMVAAVAAASSPKELIKLDSDHRGVLTGAATGAETEAPQLFLVDEFGNRLVALSAPPMTPAAIGGRGELARPASRSWARTWWVWAIPSGVAMAVGIGAGIQASSAHSDLDALLETPSPFYSDVEDLRSRYQSRTTIANVSLATAGVFAVVSGVVWFTRPRSRAPRTSLLPVVSRDGMVGLALSGDLP